MSPPNGLITGKGLDMTVESSTPPIQRLPLRRTGPVGKPLGMVKARLSRTMLLLENKKRSKFNNVGKRDGLYSFVSLVNA